MANGDPFNTTAADSACGRNARTSHSFPLTLWGPSTWKESPPPATASISCEVMRV